MRWFAKALALGCAVLAACGPTWAQACSEIRFARGAFSGEAAGQVADGAPLCYTFGSGAGQTARLQILGNDNTCFTVRGVVDCQADFSFATSAQTYEVRVFQLVRRPGAETFTLRLTIR
jgi:hypothetical protein